MPFAAEEAWSWWQSGSVHRAPWPDSGSLSGQAGEADPGLFALAATAMSAIRRAKSDAKASMRSEVAELVVHGNGEVVQRLRLVMPDVQAAGNVVSVDYRPSQDGPGFGVRLSASTATESRAGVAHRES